MTTKARVSGKSRESSFEPVRRILFLYNLLRRSSQGRKLTAQRALENMTSCGFDVSLRTVQRYLEVCETYFAGVRRDTGTPNGWWWEENTIDDSMQISKEGALALCLAEAHLKHLIPSAELKHLTPLFQQARRSIEHGGHVNRYKRMLDRIWIMPRGLQLVPPRINGFIFDAVMSAILDSTELTITYRKPSEKSARQRIIEPVGMVERSGVYYVVGRERYGSENKNWALHRISEVQPGSAFSYPKEFNVSQWAKNGHLNVRFKPDNINITVRLEESVAAHLFESKLSENQQTLVEPNGKILLSCKVENTIELRWWLMSIAHQSEVLEPQFLRDELQRMIRDALAKYKNKPTKKAG